MSRIKNYSKIFQLYSTLSFIMAILLFTKPQLFNQTISDIIKTSTVIVPILVVYLFYTKGGTSVINAYNHLFHPIKFTKIMALIFEFIFHIIPVLLVGLPNYSVSYLYLMIIMLSYYCLMYNKINNLYYPIVSNDEINNKLIIIIIIFIVSSRILIENTN